MSLILLASPTQDQAVLDEALRRRGQAVEMICHCCRLPFCETLQPGAYLPATRLNVYSRHYGKTHTNSIRLEHVELIVTDRREFVIVPSAEVRERLRAA